MVRAQISILALVMDIQYRCRRLCPNAVYRTLGAMRDELSGLPHTRRRPKFETG